MADASQTLTGHIPTPSILPPDLAHNPFPKFVAPYIGAVFFELFLYGIYCILFSICAYVLVLRKRTLHWVLFSFAIAMFSLASADIGYTLYIFFTKLLSGDLTFSTLYPKYVMFVTNTVLADCLLVYRCYVVWGGKKRVIAGPILLLIAATVCGYLFEGASAHLFEHAWVYLSMTFALNVILTGLTAGRIWYLAHRAEHIIGQGLFRRYNASIAILIESGSIYSLYMTLDLALQKNAAASAILDAGLIQIVGIVPTLIIVQVGLGRAVHNLEDEDVLVARIEANRGLANSGRSFSIDGNNNIGMRSTHTTHDARSIRDGASIGGSQVYAPRSHRGSNATLSPELTEHRKSFRSTYTSTTPHRSTYLSNYDSNASRSRTLYDLRLSTDSYTIPSSPRSLPPSPVLLKPEMGRSIEGKIYQPFTEAICLVNSRDSTRTNDPKFAPV